MSSMSGMSMSASAHHASGHRAMSPSRYQTARHARLTLDPDRPGSLHSPKQRIWPLAAESQSPMHPHRLQKSIARLNRGPAVFALRSLVYSAEAAHDAVAVTIALTDTAVMILDLHCDLPDGRYGGPPDLSTKSQVLRLTRSLCHSKVMVRAEHASTLSAPPAHSTQHAARRRLEHPVTQHLDHRAQGSDVHSPLDEKTFDRGKLILDSEVTGCEMRGEVTHRPSSEHLGSNRLSVRHSGCDLKARTPVLLQLCIAVSLSRCLACVLIFSVPEDLRHRHAAMQPCHAMPCLSRNL